MFPLLIAFCRFKLSFCSSYLYSTVKILQFDRSQKSVATILRNLANLTRGLGGHFVLIKFDLFPGAGNMGTFKRGCETPSG